MIQEKIIIDIESIKISKNRLKNSDYLYNIYKTCTECDSLYEGEGCDTCQKRREKNINKLLDIYEN